MLGKNLPFYQTIIADVLNKVDSLLNNFVFDGYMALSDYLRAPLAAVAGIYIAILSYGIMLGWVRVSISNFVKMVLKIAVIYMVVIEWGKVSEWTVNFISDLVGSLGSALVSSSNNFENINEAMQSVLSQFITLGDKLFSAGGVMSLGPLLGGLIIWIFGFLVVGLGFFEIVLSKVMLAIFVVFMPLIVICCYFKPLQPIFDRWLGSIIGFIFLQLFVTLAMGFSLNLAFWWMGLFSGQEAISLGNFGILPLVLLGFICIGLILKAAFFAGNLGGSIAAFSAESTMSESIGMAFKGGKAGVYASKQAWWAGKKVYSGARSAIQGLQSALRRGD